MAGQPAFAWVWAVLAAAPLLFPTQVPYSGVLASVFIAIPLASAWWTGQPVWPRTPLALPWLSLLVMTTVAVAISPVPDVSGPKFAGVILGAFVTRAAVLSIARRRVLRVAVTAYLAAGFLICCGGFLGTALKNEYLPASVTSRFPPRFQDVPGTGGLVNPNALGGTTLFFLPVIAALGLNRRNRTSDAVPAHHPSRARVHLQQLPALARTGLLLGTSGFVAILILSQSLTAWLAAIVTGAVLVALRSWRAAAAVALVTVAAAAYLFSVHGHVTRRLDRVAAVQAAVVVADPGFSVEDRLEIWSRALLMIQDAPYSGVGLNAFRRVAPTVYPMFLVPAGVDIAHAHNIFLQVALDVGIPGLIAYVALLLVASGLCWQVYRGGHGSDAALAVGLWGGLLGTHVFGLTDAIALGAKVGVFFWWNVGLIAAMHRLFIVGSDGGRPFAP